jgi:hypothetical protein
MASELIRDPAKDHLLTPKNSALIIIDYPARSRSSWLTATMWISTSLRSLDG